jgi:hypothetical protein
MPGIKPRALSILGKHSPTRWVTPRPISFLIKWRCAEIGLDLFPLLTFPASVWRLWGSRCVWRGAPGDVRGLSQLCICRAWMLVLHSVFSHVHVWATICHSKPLRTTTQVALHTQNVPARLCEDRNIKRTAVPPKDGMPADTLDVLLSSPLLTQNTWGN